MVGWGGGGGGGGVGDNVTIETIGSGQEAWEPETYTVYILIALYWTFYIIFMAILKCFPNKMFALQNNGRSNDNAGQNEELSDQTLTLKIIYIIVLFSHC